MDWFDNLRDDDWPHSDFSGKQVVLLYDNGSIVYSWFDMNLEQVLASPTPPQLLLNDSIELMPELFESVLVAMDHNRLNGRLIEAVVAGKEFDIHEDMRSSMFDPNQ